MGPICATSRKQSAAEMASDVVLRTRHLKKGDMLCVAGVSQPRLYAVRSGAFKISAPMLNGAQNVVDFMIRGDVIGLDSVNEPAATDVVALTRSTVCELPVSRLDALCARSSTAMTQLRALMSASIRRNQTWRVALAGCTATQKVALFLLDIAKRSGNGEQMRLELSLPMRRSDIGRYLGLRDETVSRSLAALQNSGAISVSSRVVTIRDVAALQALIEKALDNAPPSEG
jgi:CRP/FNR family transcriptional regulator